MRIHTGEKLFLFSCEKVQRLTSDMRIHTGERQLCPISWEQSVGRGAQLKAHEDPYRRKALLVKFSEEVQW